MFLPVNHLVFLLLILEILFYHVMAVLIILCFGHNAWTALPLFIHGFVGVDVSPVVPYFGQELTVIHKVPNDFSQPRVVPCDCQFLLQSVQTLHFGVGVLEQVKECLCFVGIFATTDHNAKTFETEEVNKLIWFILTGLDYRLQAYLTTAMLGRWLGH